VKVIPGADIFCLAMMEGNFMKNYISYFNIISFLLDFGEDKAQFFPLLSNS